MQPDLRHCLLILSDILNVSNTKPTFRDESNAFSQHQYVHSSWVFNELFYEKLFSWRPLIHQEVLRKDFTMKGHVYETYAPTEGT